jgi:hypothetical protein
LHEIKSGHRFIAAAAQAGTVRLSANADLGAVLDRDCVDATAI